MPLINVNHKKLRTLAKTIDEFCTEHERKMEGLDEAVMDMLTFDWKGDDADEFYRSWDTSDEKALADMRFRAALRTYSDQLKKCADVYSNAQASICTMAKKLKK